MGFRQEKSVIINFTLYLQNIHFSWLQQWIFIFYAVLWKTTFTFLQQISIIHPTKSQPSEIKGNLWIYPSRHTFRMGTKWTFPGISLSLIHPTQSHSIPPIQIGEQTKKQLHCSGHLLWSGTELVFPGFLTVVILQFVLAKAINWPEPPDFLIILLLSPHDFSLLLFDEQ